MLVGQDLNMIKLKHSSFSRAVLSQWERRSGESNLLIMFLVYFPFLWLHVGT